MEKDDDDSEDEDEDNDGDESITEEERELLVKNLVVARIRQLPDSFRISFG